MKFQMKIRIFVILELIDIIIFEIIKKNTDWRCHCCYYHLSKENRKEIIKLLLF
jgi:hypothetical protein